MAPHPDIRVLSSRKAFTGEIFEVHQDALLLPSGRRQDLAVVRHPGAVAIAAELDDGRILLVRQYRHSAGDWLIELPAGRLEPGEEPLAAARRELEEETGYRASEWQLLYRFYPAPGFCSEVIFLFHARGLTPVRGGGLPADPDEELQLLKRPPAALLEPEIEDAKTLLAGALLLGRRPAPG